MIPPEQIAAIERATASAVAPERVVELPGWLVCLDAGAIGRAKSAVPLTHTLGADRIGEIESLYRDAGRAALFRVAEAEGLGGLRTALAQGGYLASTPTWVATAETRAVMERAPAGPVELAAAPPPGWGQVFMGPGFDPQEGAQRVAALSRSPGAAFAALRAGPEIVAVGVAAFGHGWASVHGMRTKADQRGRGLASLILGALAREALSRGYAQMFLQVEDPNPARALYRRLGFMEQWRYQYWARP